MMKQILPLLLFVLSAMAIQQKTMAQQIKPDTSYHLFFYKGKKVKENVLLTPLGDTVSYNPAKRTLKKVSKSGTGKKLDNMLAEVNKTDQRMKEMIRKLAAGLPRTVAPYYAKPLKESYDETKEIYYDALLNTMEIPAMTVNARQKNELEKQFESWEMQLISEIRAFIKKCNETSLDVPAPPEKDYRYCSQCDKEKRLAYEKAVRQFGKEFEKEEQELLGKINAYAHEWQIAGGPAHDDESEIQVAYKFILTRMVKKANLLLEKYSNDPLRAQSVIGAALGVERTRELSGVSETEVYPVKFDYITTIMNNRLNWVLKAFDEYDYSVVLHPGIILGLEREKEMLGVISGKDDAGLLLKRFSDFNSFKLNIKISGKLAGSDFMQVAELKGDNYFAAVIDSATRTTCKLKWVLLGPDPEKKNMQFDLTDVKMQGGGKEIVYAGTKKWRSPVPKLRIDFCDNGNDTAMITSFRPDGKETWIVPEYGPMDAPYMSNVLLGCFMDIDRLKKEANKEEMEKKMAAMKRQAEEFKKNYPAGQMPSQSQINSMMAMSKALSAGSMVSDMMQEYAIGSYLILPKPQNKNKVVFKERLDGKKLFPENPKIEYGWLEITLEQDADSLFKMKM